MTLVVWNMTLGGEEMQTTCDAFFGGGGGGGEVPESGVQATALADFWANGLAFLMTEELALTSMQIGENLYTIPRAGSIERASVPSNVAVVIRKKVIGGNNGRFFIPGVTDANVDNAGRLDGAFKTAFVTSMNSAFAALTAATVALRVKQADGSFALIDSFQLAPIVGTQKRRLATR